LVSFTPRPLYTRRKSRLYPLDRRLRGPQSRSGRHGEKKILDPTRIRTPIPRVSTDSEIKTEKKSHELLEKDIERGEDDDLVLKSLLPDIKYLLQWRKRRLRLKSQEFVTNFVEKAEGLLTRLPCIIHIPERNTFPV
jgi:hypothetical protein